MADLLKRFKHTVDKGVATVSIKSNAAIEINKIKVYMNNLQDRIEGRKKDLGEMIYKVYVEGGLEENGYIEICKEINELYKQYEEKKEEIEKIKQQELEILGGRGKHKVCSCGTRIEAEVKFCEVCGKPVG